MEERGEEAAAARPKPELEVPAAKRPRMQREKSEAVPSAPSETDERRRNPDFTYVPQEPAPYAQGLWVPVARVKRLVGVVRPDLKMTKEALLLTSKATEMFCQWIGEQSFFVAHHQCSRTIKPDHVDVSFMTAEQLRFLRETFQSMPPSDDEGPEGELPQPAAVAPPRALPEPSSAQAAAAAGAASEEAEAAEAGGLQKKKKEEEEEKVVAEPGHEGKKEEEEEEEGVPREAPHEENKEAKEQQGDDKAAKQEE